MACSRHSTLLGALAVPLSRRASTPRWPWQQPESIGDFSLCGHGSGHFRAEVRPPDCDLIGEAKGGAVLISLGSDLMSLVRAGDSTSLVAMSATTLSSAGDCQQDRPEDPGDQAGGGDPGSADTNSADSPLCVRRNGRSHQEPSGRPAAYQQAKQAWSVGSALPRWRMPQQFATSKLIDRIRTVTLERASESLRNREAGVLRRRPLHCRADRCANKVTGLKKRPGACPPRFFPGGKKHPGRYASKHFNAVDHQEPERVAGIQLSPSADALVRSGWRWSGKSEKPRVGLCDMTPQSKQSTGFLASAVSSIRQLSSCK